MMNRLLNINERILYIIDNKVNSNKKKFAEMIGFAPQVVSNIVSGRKSKPSFDVLNAIKTSFDDLDSNWLLTGEGEMLKQEQPKQEVSNVDYKEKYYKVLEEKDILSQQIITLQQQLLGNTSNMEDNMNRSVG
ncbi:helix-turn-helix domain-containing protein [Tenacibaculum dicentrarchi]|uniref:helix-turn-helix domain-containing protein n=1 Tax=Tenacibaculum dicentrarchi TaxID=669041 RepID=UPI001E640C68|nr:helix-turn-helix domain-containing protein [Tenacibaculum dicentrarchi]